MQRLRKKHAIGLLLGGVVIGMFLLSPVGAHVGNKVSHLWNRHLKAKVARLAEEEAFVKVGDPIVVGAGTFGGGQLLCPPGYEALGGGVDVENVATMDVTSSAPVFGRPTTFLNDQTAGRYPAASGWSGFVRNDGGAPRTMRISATCSRT